MITATQIQTVLNHASLAQTTLGQALADSPAFAALVQVGQGLAAGKTLQWAPEPKAKKGAP